MFMCCRRRCILIVEGASGGRWSFPLEFSASEPEPDDVIYIEAAGLNKLSTTSFYLSSNLEYDITLLLDQEIICSALILLL